MDSTSPQCQSTFVFLQLTFTKQEWRFGLHSCEELNTSGSEAIKLWIASALGLVGQKWKDFCENVVSDECLLDIQQCYDLREEETILTDEVIRYILVLDALFLVVYMEGCGLPLQERFVRTGANRILPIKGISKVEYCGFWSSQTWKSSAVQSHHQRCFMCYPRPGLYPWELWRLDEDIDSMGTSRSSLGIHGESFRTPRLVDMVDIFCCLLLYIKDALHFSLTSLRIRKTK